MKLSVVFDHYLTRILTRIRKERMSLQVQRYKQTLAPSLLVVNSLACFTASRGHMPTNHVRLVPWHFKLYGMIFLAMFRQHICFAFHKNVNNTVILFWHLFEQFFASILRFSLHKLIEIVGYNAVSCACTPFFCTTGYPSTAFFCAVIDANS